MSFEAEEMKAHNLLHCKFCQVGSNQSHLQFKLKKGNFAMKYMVDVYGVLSRFAVYQLWETTQ